MAYRAESSRFESGRRIPRNTVTTVELKNGHITTFYMKWGNDSHSVLHSHLGQENKNNSKEILPAKISEDIPIPRWAQLKMKRLQERKYSSKQPWRSLGGGGLEYFCHLLAHCNSCYAVRFISKLYTDLQTRAFLNTAWENSKSGELVSPCAFLSELMQT